MDSQLLLVDDEQPILDMLRLVLHKEGFQYIATATTGAEAIAQCRAVRPQIIVLDIMLPDMEGFEVCRQIRRISTAPILFVTARSSDLDKLMGFGIGGDDYITKPFNPLELVARIKAQLRRQTLVQPDVTEDERVFEIGHFQVYEQSARLNVYGADVVCPAREFQLLLFLCKHPNRVFSRVQLYEKVWGEHSVGDDNTVMVHIRRLREKIEPDPSHPRYLVTIRGLGYKLASHPGTGEQK